MLEAGRSRYRWIILIVTTLVTISGSIPLQAYPVALPSIMKEFKLSVDTASAGFTAFALGGLMALLVGGFLSVRIGMRRTVLVAAILFIIPQFVIPATPDFATMVALRFVQGFMWLVIPPMLILLREWFRQEQGGLAVGIQLGGWFIGSAIGGFVAGYFLQSGFEWRQMFNFTGFLILAGIVPFFIFAKHPGKIMKPASLTSPVDNDVGAKAGKGPHRMIETWLLGLSAFAWNWSLYTFFGAIPPFLFNVNYPPLQVGFVALVFGVVAFFGAAIGGGLGDRWTRKSRELLPARIRMILTGYILAMIGWIFLVAVGSEFFVVVLVATVLVSFGVNAAVTHIFALTTQLYPARLVGVGAGYVTFVGTIPAPMAAQVSIFSAASFGWTSAWVISLVVLGTAGVISPLVLAAKKKPLLRRFTEVELLYRRYQKHLKNIKKDWELNRVELSREFDVLKKSIVDGQEALTELDVLYHLDEVGSQEYERRKMALDESLRYLKGQADFIEASAAQIDSIASKHTIGLSLTVTSGGMDAHSHVSPLVLAVKEKLMKLETMYEAGRVKHGLYHRLKEDYARKLKQATG